MEQRENQSPNVRDDNAARGQQDHDAQGGAASTGQASYGNSGDSALRSQGSGPSTGAAGQAAQTSPETGADQADTMIERPDSSSTSAQRSGGQNAGGAGSDDRSFAGSSFGGQSGSAIGGTTDDNSDAYVQEAATGAADQNFDRDGQGAGDTSMESNERETDQESDLDGQ